MSAVAGPAAPLAQAMAHALRLLERSPALALEQAEEILRQAGPHPPARLVQAIARERCGQGPAAIKEMESLVSGHPGWATAQIELGLMLGRAGQGERAISWLQRGLALAPELGVTAGHGDVVEEDVAVGVASHGGDHVLERVLGAGVGATGDDQAASAHLRPGK